MSETLKQYRDRLLPLWDRPASVTVPLRDLWVLIEDLHSINRQPYGTAQDIYDRAVNGITVVSLFGVRLVPESIAT